MSKAVFFEISWEVCNMVGGIHTVLASRVHEVQERHGEDGYITIGPDIPRGDDFTPEFRPDIWDRELAASLQDYEVGVVMGRWLVPGEPRCLLINHSRLYERKDEILGGYWERYELDSLFGDWDYYDPVLFGHGAGMVIEHIRDQFLLPARQNAVVQAHEWMSAGAILHLQTAAPEIGTVFTTHATMLGRSLAGQRADPNLYQSLPSIDPEAAAKELNVSSKHSMESVAAHEADVFTTVSEIAAMECECLLGRRPDVTLLNGFGARPVTPDQRQRAREELFKLAELTTGDRYDRDNTLIFALAGRYEYINKGVDVYLDAAAALDEGLKSRDGKRVLVYAMLPAGHAEPKRQLWDRSHGTFTGPPLRCTHDLVDEANDPITNQLNALGLVNAPGASVHVVHVPIYLDGTDALIRHKYWDLLPGADLGVFPSFYEPWGYTPLEAVAFGVPAVTTDRAGFGRWVAAQGDGDHTGVRVLKREGVPTEEVTESLTSALLEFVDLSERDRSALGEACLRTAALTDWSNFMEHYEEAHRRALEAGAARRKELPMERLSVPSMPARSSDSSGVFGLFVKPPVKEGEEPAAYTRTFVVANPLPVELKGLKEIASNLWWRWHPEVASLFKRIDPELWFEVEENPHALLDQVKPGRLMAAADDVAYVADVERLHQEMLESTQSQDPRIAYFCMEFGLAGFLKLYSGGLGILAGDHLKAASDLNLPLCAVGLAYHDGYFRQIIDRDGHQEHLGDTNDFENPPFEPVMVGQYSPLRVTVPLPTGPVQVQAWQLKVGRVPLFLLDTNLPENRPEDRAITNRLYGGDTAHRLRQEMVLGVGGYQLLTELDIDPDVFHMNEGHSAFLLLARAAHLIKRHGLRSQEAFEYIRNTTVFTTHTPVPAGHDHFPEQMIRPYLSRFEHVLRMDWQRLVAIGHTPDSAANEFGTTALAVRNAGRINGVSAKHGEVARDMFRQFYPDFEDADDVPCTSITNGVHVSTWLAPRWQRLMERQMGHDWRDQIEDRESWRWLRDHDPAEIWSTHRELRADYIEWLKEHLTETWTRRREDLSLLRDILGRLDEERMLIGFARRFAPYKRADLLLTEPERLSKLLNGTPGATIIYAGKAHPADGHGQALLQRVYQATKHPDLAGRVIFMEGYAIDSARRMLAGCDVWLNTPTRPLEASGTSGMKAAINGCLNLSVDDGWWIEGYEQNNGWVIDLPATSIHDPSAYDRAVTMALLEGEIIPTYHDRGADGVPVAWVDRMKASMSSIIPRFSARRMVTDYADTFYEPAMQDAVALRDANYRPLFDLADLAEEIRAHWSEIAMESVRFGGLSGGELVVGQTVSTELSLRHPGLDVRDLLVEAVVTYGSRLHDASPRIVVPFESEDGEERSTWRGAFTVRASGGHELRFRVRPRDRSNVRPGALSMHIQKWL
ncbi:MAG: alpha-glucan family phosphorylase [Deltaproteobacteria bacterium]|nr:alpha-glucan family phosphorylase [Deltaproteobacteria bacterium]NND30015.1 alpha-glucan family phosphorylase [Myxococcales bacterium]MBT8466401.1 alpha-glucan family phosphorylase [Deltaproteobacteria bacterium]NNK08126.1 alpha-glucan family phosphorylase [Myxococcales bacterium]NNK42991.1 alpha-glucan family phosphorylase [Myxococcales bacterium]